jgi:hypothetical protein
MGNSRAAIRYDGWSKKLFFVYLKRYPKKTLKNNLTSRPLTAIFLLLKYYCTYLHSIKKAWPRAFSFPASAPQRAMPSAMIYVWMVRPSLPGYALLPQGDIKPTV